MTKSRFKGVLLDLFNYLEYETSYACGQFCIRFPCELFFLMKKMDSHSDISLEGGTKDFFFEGRKNEQKWHIFFDLFKSDIDKAKKLICVAQIYPWH